MNDPTTISKRYTDTTDVIAHDEQSTTRINSDAGISRRQSDETLLKRFSKRDATSRTTDIEMPFGENDLIISRTDTRGTITSCNDAFSKIAGWSKEELMGSNHNLIRHPCMPQSVFKLAWETIKAKKEFYGYVKNLCKDGSYYWAFAYITADLDDNDEIEGYTSYRRYVHKDIPPIIEPIYKHLLMIEDNDGVEAAETSFSNLLNERNLSYDMFVINLQANHRF